MPIFLVTLTRVMTIYAEIEATTRRDAAHIFHDGINRYPDIVDGVEIIGFDKELNQPVFENEGFVTVDEGTFLFRANDENGLVRILHNKPKKRPEAT